MSNVYVSEFGSPGGNAKTDELKRLFAAVREHVPAVTPCPEKDPYPDDDRIRAVWYEGEECCGRKTRVFAYLGFPKGASAGEKVPAVVTVHGGGCHAWAPWVRYWVDRGYAAISPDCFGQIYAGKDSPYETDIACWAVDPDSHLPMDGLTTRGKPFREQWYYYCIADIILANNLLRADARVDAFRIGLTGISWGGVATGTAIGYDDRFAFAVPVYGCGFAELTKSPWGAGFGGEGVTDVWDAKLLLPEVKIPLLWVNGDNDPFFSADATTASAAASPNGAATLVHDFIHGMDQGIDLPEILRFADEHTGRGAGNIKITSVSFDAAEASVAFTLPPDIRAPELYVWYKRTPIEYEGPKHKDCPDLAEPWQPAPGVVHGSGGTVRFPEGTRLFYLQVRGMAEGLPDGQFLQATSGVFVRPE